MKDYMTTEEHIAWMYGFLFTHRNSISEKAFTKLKTLVDSLEEGLLTKNLYVCSMYGILSGSSFDALGFNKPHNTNYEACRQLNRVLDKYACSEDTPKKWWKLL